MHNLIQRVDIILLQEVGQHVEASTLSYDVLRRALPDHWQLCADNAYMAAWNKFKLVRGNTTLRKVWPQDASSPYPCTLR